MHKQILFPLVTLLGVMLLALSAQAHCAWIEAPSSTASVDETVLIRSFWADPDDEPGQRDTADLELYYRSPSHETSPLKPDRKERYQYTQKQLGTEGSHVFYAIREPARHRLTQYRDFAKAITSVGVAQVTEPIGLELEITPLVPVDPLLKEVPVVVTFLGEVLPEATVQVVESLEPGGDVYQSLHGNHALEIVTDHKGQAVIPLGKDHQHIVKVRHQVGSSEVPQETGRWIRSVVFRSTLYLDAGIGK
ncbi:DUF4198 domain-containing protein [Desulfurispira natronophila]|uniref:Putative GH25 family protein n=1 Tax=Desulfurispira natronophila TaxID=682562 RepID=A0A7W7Y3R0_9BACT|nr:DUF4198 domain-containing protein [Desulfurispira natronophila]MBB5021523.1 putative GH25 family protein [Desulfurispira natronophila]